jgi:hypothetical protein
VCYGIPDTSISVVDKDVINNARNDNKIKMIVPKDSEKAFSIKIVGSHRGDCGENNECQGATYLIMPLTSLSYEIALSEYLDHQNIVEVLTFAEENGAQV